MKKMIAVAKKYFGIIKTLFALSIVFVVVRELLVISRSLSYESLLSTLSEIALWKIALLIVFGFVAVSPMLGYDWVLNRSLKQQLTKKYLFQTSWMINTMNNVVGFGGVISIGLRTYFYGKSQESKVMAQSLSKVFLFMMSGLSMYSLLAFLLIWLPNEPSVVQDYWPWLLGGSFYFPGALIISAIANRTSSINVNRREQFALIATSFLEWTGVLGTFLLVGKAMGISYQLQEVLPLFIAASVIGIVSMIPGSLGSFDLIMLLGLSKLGFSKELVASWLLLYRLFYFILPFLSSVPLFTYTTGKRLNERYEDVPKKIVDTLLHKSTVIGFYGFGILLMSSNVLPQWFDRYTLIRQFHSDDWHFITQLPNILLGLFFILIGRGIAAKVQRSYFPAIALTICAFAYCFVSGYGFFVLSYLVVLLLLTYSSRQELFRKQLVYAWEWLTIDGVLLCLLSLSYLVLGVEQIEQWRRKGELHPRLFVFVSQTLEEHWLYSFSLLFLMALLSWGLIRYLQGEKIQLGQEFDEEIIEHILHTYGGNLDSQLVFLKDKRIFIYRKEEEPTVFFQFSLYNNKCIVMGDPSGDKADFKAAIAALIQEAEVLGYTPVFYEVSESFVFLLHEYGYEFFKMGEEARVFLPEFSLTGKKMKGNRALINRLTKEGYSFEVLKPPFSQPLMAELKVISDAWLGSRKEKGFSLGFFSEEYLQRSEIAVVRNSENQIVAFANLMPVYDAEVATIDLMRHHPEKAPSGSMDYLFIHLFEWTKAQDIASFSLGMAPLANVGVMPKSFVQERIAHLVYQFGSRFYSFQGLRKYKAKYTSQWVPHYLLYHRETWILYVMIALLKVDEKRPNNEESA